MKKYLYLASMVALIAGTNPVYAQEEGVAPAEGAGGDRTIELLTKEGVASFSAEPDKCDAELNELKEAYIDATGNVVATINAANAELEAAGQGNAEVMATVSDIKKKYAGEAGEEKGYTGDKASASYREYKKGDLDTKYPADNCADSLGKLQVKMNEHIDKLLADVEAYNAAVAKVNAAAPAEGSATAEAPVVPDANQEGAQQ